MSQSKVLEHAEICNTAFAACSKEIHAADQLILESMVQNLLIEFACYGPSTCAHFEVI